MQHPIVLQTRLLVSLLLLSSFIAGCLDSGGDRPGQDRGEAHRQLADNRECSPSLRSLSTRERAAILRERFERAIACSEEERVQSEYEFFCAFPSSFSEMNELYGFSDEEGPKILYDGGGKQIELFKRLGSVPPEEYYQKYVDISIGGVWEADNIQGAFGFGERLTSDTKNACLYLSMRSDEEIVSLFHFLFDGPHPDDKDALAEFETLHKIVAAESERLGKLMESAYAMLLAESDGHGG